MAEVNETARSAPDQTSRLPGGDLGFAGWSRAWTHLAKGFMSAGLAQIDLARTLLTPFPAEWPTTSETPASADVAHLWVQTAQIRFDATLQTYRKISDDLTASLFAAADSLVDASVPLPSKTELPPPFRAAAAKQR